MFGDRIAPVGVIEQHPIPRARPGGAVLEPILPGHELGGVLVLGDLDPIAVEVEEDWLRAGLLRVVLGFGGSLGFGLYDLFLARWRVDGLLCSGLGDARIILGRRRRLGVAVAVLAD